MILTAVNPSDRPIIAKILALVPATEDWTKAVTAATVPAVA